MRALFVILILTALSLVVSVHHKKAQELTSRDPDPLIQKVQPMKDGKSKWPDLVGKTATEAEAVIRADRPDLSLHTLPKVGNTKISTVYLKFSVRMLW